MIFDKLEKIVLGSILGFIAFCLFTGLVIRIFQKSPEQIARERCADMQRFAQVYLAGQPSIPSMTVSINDVTYHCN